MFVLVSDVQCLSGSLYDAVNSICYNTFCLSDGKTLLKLILRSINQAVVIRLLKGQNLASH